MICFLIYIRVGIFNYFETFFFFQEDEEIMIQSVPVDLNISNPELGCVFCPIAPAYCEKVNIYHVNNASLCPPYKIILQNGDVFFMFKNATRFTKLPSHDVEEIKPIIGYKNALYVTSAWNGPYGHFFTDAVGGLMLIPEWIWTLQPVFLTHFQPDLVDFVFSSFGHPNVTVVNMKSKFYYYAENFFLITGNEQWHTFGLHTFYIMKRKIRDYYKLTIIKPTKYHYINKKPGKRRHFINLNEVMEIARHETQLDWTLINTTFKDRLAQAKVYAESRMIVSPSGSISFNTLFMEDGTGLISLNANKIDAPQTFFCQMIRIWNIIIIHENMGHFGKPGYADTDKVIINIKRMLYTIEHQRLPSEDLFDLSPFETAKRIFYEYGEDSCKSFDEAVVPSYKYYRKLLGYEYDNYTY